MDVIEILEEFEEFFMQMNVIWLVLYPLIWSILIDGFYDIAVRMEGLLESVLSFGGVMQSDAMQTLYDYLTPLAFVFLAVAIIGIAFQLIVGKTVQKTNVLLNVVLAVSVILLLPWMVMQLGELSDDFIEVSQSAGVEDNIEVSALSTQIVQTNTRDVVYLARNDFTEEDNNINNTITDGNIRNIDFTEVVHPDPDDSGNRDYGENENGDRINQEDVFVNKIVDDDDGEQTTEEIEPFELSIIGEIPILNEYYYRYTGNFVNMFAQLGILIAVMLFTSFKVIRLFFEIAFANIIAPFVATTDLSTGQRTKQLLKDLVINFSVVGLVMLVFRLFMLMMNYLGTLDLNPIVVTVVMFALGLATIDGPDQAKKLLGIDIGVKDGYKQLMGGLAVGAAATKATSGVRSHIGNEKDKFMQQRQEKKDDKDSKAEQLSGTGANSNDGNAYSIDNDLNHALNNDGYMNRDNNQSASSANVDGVSAENQKAGKGAASEGADGIAANNEADGTAAVSASVSQQQSLENLVQNAESDLDDKERNVLEKVMTEGSASLDADERDTLNGIASSDAISTDEKQALVQTIGSDDGMSDGISNRDVGENLNGDTAGSISADEKQVLENLVSGDNSNISDDEKQVLENLISNGSDNMSQGDRQVVENLVSNGNSNTSADEKQVLENLISSDGSQSDQSKNVLENLVSNDNGNISSGEKQVLENLISNGSDNMSQGDRQVVENLISNDSNNMSQGEKQVLENIISNDSGSVGTGKRQTIENVVSSSNQSSPVQQHVEQVMANQASVEPATQRMIQTLSNEGNMTAPDIQQNVVRMMNDGSIGGQEADSVINTQHASTGATTEQRQVVENVLSNHQELQGKDRTSIENVVTQSANISPQERQVFEKVMEAPHSMSQSDRQVLENVVSNDNNLTAKESTAIENVVQNHATNQAPPQASTNTQVTQTEDIVRNMRTNFNTDGSRMADIKRQHQEMNNRWEK